MESVKKLLLVLVCYGFLSCAQAGDALTRTNNGRILSIFNVVTFKNEECTGSSSTVGDPVKGTCFSASECASKSNSRADGNCASGFGVCCVIAISACSSTVTENCTYVQNTNYGSAYSTTSTTCTTSISRSSSYSLCQIRLDFAKFITSINTDGSCGTAADSFTVSAPFTTSSAAFPPTLCGTLTGQHMYFETGNIGDPMLTLSTGTGSFSRFWRIKVTYIECGNVLRAPSGCDQYHTGTTGTIVSYGYSTLQPQSLRSSYCVRQESGFCSMDWRKNPAETSGFSVSAPADASETTCPSASVSIGSALFCGSKFNSIDASTVDSVISTSDLPFKVYHYSAASTQAGYTGFSLIYTQMGC